MSKPDSSAKTARIFYARTDEFWRKGEKYAFLEEKGHVGGVEWQELQPDAKGNWLTVGLQDEFESFFPLGTREDKTTQRANTETLFKNYGRGVATTRDVWAYNFNKIVLEENIKLIIETFNEQVYKWTREARDKEKLEAVS